MTSEERILAALENGPPTNIPKLAAELGIKEITVSWHVGNLAKRGLAEKVGEERAAHGHMRSIWSAVRPIDDSNAPECVARVASKLTRQALMNRGPLAEAWWPHV